MDHELETLEEGRQRPPKPFNQACALQRVAYDRAMASDTPSRDVAQLMRAWEVLEERKRILRMKPAPKPVDVGVRGPSKRALKSSLVPLPQASDAAGAVPGASAPTGTQGA